MRQLSSEATVVEAVQNASSTRRSPAARERGGELAADARGRIGIGEEDRSERDVGRAARDQLEYVASVLHTAHADDRQLRRATAPYTAASATGFSAGPE